MSAGGLEAAALQPEAYTFWTGADGDLWEAQGKANGGLAAGVNRGMGPLGSAPAAGVDDSGNTYVYWKGADGNLWDGYWNGAKWVGPYNRGMGQLGSQPAVAITPSTTALTWVFWKGTDGNLWEGYWNGAKWVGPYDRGMGQLGSQPTVAIYH